LWSALTALNFALLLGSWSTTGQADGEVHPTVLRAQAIELVDARGEVRVQLHLGDDGSGNIRLRDGRGQVRVKLGTSADGATGLLLMDQSVEPTVRLAADRPAAA
jgi:hypothetical protein